MQADVIQDFKFQIILLHKSLTIFRNVKFINELQTGTELYTPYY